MTGDRLSGEGWSQGVTDRLSGEGWCQACSVGKALGAKFDDLSSVPEIHMMEHEN